MASFLSSPTYVADFSGLFVAARAFGARGDGITDDTAALQAAIDSLGPEGGLVLLEPGTYVHRGLVLKNRTGFKGAGMRATTLYLKDGSNVSSIKNYVSADGVEANAMFTRLEDLRLDGNKAGQTGTSHGIELNTNPAFGTQATGDDDFDSHQIVSNVLIQNALTDGFKASGRSLHFLSNVEALYCDRYGFNPSFDTTMVGCVAGQSGQHGFHLAQPNQRLTNCNSYYSGNVSGSQGIGFYIIGKQGPYTLTGCIAQDNRAAGFTLDTCGRVTLVGCLADSNSTSSVGTYPGYSLWDTQGSVIEGCISQERQVVAGISPQRNALQIRAGSTGNQIAITHTATDSGNGTATIGVPILLGGGSDSVAGNDIRFNGQEGYQSVAFASTITPVPYNGNRIGITLTGNITTLNVPASGQAHPGLEMTFVFTQDATGGRTVTFAAGYKVNWTPDTAANKVNTITFVYNGTNWLQKAATVGL